jgi:hypothetical protein
MADFVLTVVQETRAEMSFASKWALWCDRLLKDATPIHGVDDLVTLVVNTVAANKKTIDKLVINGHGNNTGFRIGSDWIDETSIKDFRPSLAKIAPNLSKGATVEVAACNAGGAASLMRTFSQILGGVGIIGYNTLQTGGFPGSGPMTISDAQSSYSPVAPVAGVQPPFPPLPAAN